ncbi:hypothetical protein Tsubulata_020884 [Turnera subulata]|uniref:Uncharacterized protein n=1 Tax=Turnera subulata TaxID=218843 RepID=A0A9Q0FHM5_9ROSI|nr:hypothetical protein Tsubulata_020884 [Turnera subulata]
MWTRSCISSGTYQEDEDLKQCHLDKFFKLQARDFLLLWNTVKLYRQGASMSGSEVSINVVVQRIATAVIQIFSTSLTGTTKYGVIAATATVIFTGIYIGWTYGKHCYQGGKEIRRFHSRSMSLATLHGGKMALERLINYEKALADEASLKDAEVQLQALLKEEHPDFRRLQGVVAKLEMSGKEADAVKILGTELQTAKAGGKSHEAYEIEMLLVEMLIYQGEFAKALNCECLNHKQISDARRPFYKAIIQLMLENPDEAKRHWTEFKNIRIHFQHPPGSQQNQPRAAVMNFNEFEKLVKALKNDIADAYKKA